MVEVALDALQQIESHLMNRHYDGFLSKGKIKEENEDNNDFSKNKHEISLLSESCKM